MRTTRVLALLAAALVVAGAVVTATAPATAFGWFAYAPLPGDDYVAPSLADGPGPPLLPLALGGQQLLGTGLVVLGLVVAGVALGVALGTSRGRRRAR